MRFGTALSHATFRAGGVLSIFLGSFTSELDVDSYLSSTFSSAFGFVIDPRAGPEYTTQSDPKTPVEALLTGFSESERFAVPVARALREDGWTEAPAAVVFFHLAYDPTLFPKFNNLGPLKFVGRFDLKLRRWTSWPWVAE